MNLKHLADSLRKNNCVAFLGAGVSKEYYDKKNHKEYQGLPTAQEFVQILSDSDPSLIEPNMSFEKACFLYREEYKKHGLSRLLENTYGKKINPLPAHLLLAELPFSAYISMNYDTLLELSLKGCNKNFLRIVSDADIARTSLSDIPLIYPHGCIADPSSCLTTQDEIFPFFKNKVIIKSLIRVLLASKSIIFLGFSLGDSDFHELYRELQEILGDHVPASYAIVKECTSYDMKYWNKQGIKIIDDDLNFFLENLFHEYYGGNYSESRNNWLLNEFFIALHGIHNIQSESQALDSFIHHTQNELDNAAIDIDALAERAQGAKDHLLEYRPNFEAFRTCSEKIIGYLKGGCNRLKIQNNIQDLKDQREKISTMIRSNSRKITQLHDLLDGGGVLLYSQSNRVIDVLLSMPAAIQENCTLYIAECRPKSPSSFQDALSFCMKLEDTLYKKIIIPDIVMGNLFDSGKISCAFLGAHTIIIDNDNNPKQFINTSGSLVIKHLCSIYNKTLILVAESDKETKKMDVSFEEEASLKSRFDPKIRAYISNEMRLDTQNIGYDVVSCTELNEKRLFIHISERTTVDDKVG